ncbi:MAG TPA: hypothetical protein VFT04_10830 [Gemmatimonadales bacterium]|nr:hypothetical protein [Gemmatimonadales bacterium]
MNRFRISAIVLALTAAEAAPAAAQVLGLPVENAGVVSGLGLSFDGGLPNDAAGGGHAFGATAALGLGPLGVTARISRFSPDIDEPLWSGGATLNYKVFGGPLVPIAATLQAGAGYSSPDVACVPPGACEVNEWRFPVGLGVSLTIPNPALAIKPWIAPRVDIVRSSLDGTSTTETDFGISGGVQLNLLTGLGLHATYDLMMVDPENRGIFGAGLHYNFRIPGL